MNDGFLEARDIGIPRKILRGDAHLWKLINSPSGALNAQPLKRFPDLCSTLLKDYANFQTAIRG